MPYERGPCHSEARYLADSYQVVTGALRNLSHTRQMLSGAIKIPNLRIGMTNHSLLLCVHCQQDVDVLKHGVRRRVWGINLTSAKKQ